MVRSLRQILCGPGWTNHFDFYDLIDHISFREDGSGDACWGDGQAVKAEFVFQFEFLATDRMRLECFEPWQLMLPADGRLADWNQLVERFELGFSLVKGPHVVLNKNQMGPPVVEVFRWCLRFDRSPFPLNCGRLGASCDYFGWPLRKRRRRKAS
jgi:hypothetical protein